MPVPGQVEVHGTDRNCNRYSRLLGEVLAGGRSLNLAMVQAGQVVLSASGEQTRETLALPVADDIAGMLETGQLIRVGPDGDDWRGLVRAVSLAASVDGNGALTIEQTAELERHLETV